MMIFPERSAGSTYWVDAEGRHHRKLGVAPEEVMVPAAETDETWALDRLRWIYGCGCGRPEESYELIRQILDVMPLHTDDGDEKCLALFGGNLGAMQIVLHRMTDADLITHGGGIGGSWLEPDGERMRSVLQNVPDFDEWHVESWEWKAVEPRVPTLAHDATLNTVEEARAYVARWSYKPDAHVSFVDSVVRPGLSLCFQARVPDSRELGNSNPGALIPIGRTTHLDHRPPFNASYVRALIVDGWKSLEDHEVGEWIRFDGQLLDDPHQSAEVFSSYVAGVPMSVERTT